MKVGLDGSLQMALFTVKLRWSKIGKNRVPVSFSKEVLGNGYLALSFSVIATRNHILAPSFAFSIGGSQKLHDILIFL